MTGAVLAALARPLTAGTSLDEFLAGADHTGDDRLRQIGVGLALVGTLVGVGVLVFLATVHAGRQAEIQQMLRLAAGCGCLVVLGAVAELTGIARRFEVGWTDALQLDLAAAALLRLLGGTLLVAGLTDQTVDLTDSDARRWVPASGSAFGIAGAVIAVMSFAFDGHTVSKGPRALHALANVVHVTAGGVWLGGIVALIVVAWSRHRSGDRNTIAGMVVRFSSIATLALIAVASAGAAMSMMIVDDVNDYFDTEWGRRLIVKVIAVAVAALLGAYNHFSLVPRLRSDPEDRQTLRSVHTTLVLEAIALAFVVVTTSYLLRASIAAGS